MIDKNPMTTSMAAAIDSRVAGNFQQTKNVKNQKF